MTPLLIKVPATINIAKKNDGPNLLLGTNVKGPFFKNLVTPKEPDKTLNIKETRKNVCLSSIPSK